MLIRGHGLGRQNASQSPMPGPGLDAGMDVLGEAAAGPEFGDSQRVQRSECCRDQNNTMTVAVAVLGTKHGTLLRSM